MNKDSIKNKKIISKTKKFKCSFCNKKLTMIRFDCKCGGTFCSVHRYTHTHNCQYNSKNIELNKEKINQNNPKIEKDKLEKI